MPKFTETFVADLVPDGRDYIVSDARVPRLKLRVTPSGTKTFLAKLRIGGRERKIPIGRHPGMTVSRAREEALQLIADTLRGADPVIERKVRRQSATAGEITIAQLADKWMHDYVRPKLKIAYPAHLASARALIGCSH
jgi:Arm DNA-binding domain